MPVTTLDLSGVGGSGSAPRDNAMGELSREQHGEHRREDDALRLDSRLSPEHVLNAPAGRGEEHGAVRDGDGTGFTGRRGKFDEEGTALRGGRRSAEDVGERVEYHGGQRLGSSHRGEHRHPHLDVNVEGGHNHKAHHGIGTHKGDLSMLNDEVNMEDSQEVPLIRAQITAEDDAEGTAQFAQGVAFLSLAVFTYFVLICQGLASRSTKSRGILAR